MAVSAACLFGWLVMEVRTGGTLSADHELRAMVHRHSTPALTYLMRALTLLGSVMAPALLVPPALWLWRRKRFRAPAQLVLLTMAGAGVLDLSLKLVVPRARPEPFFGLAAPTLSSFPSGHALLSLSLYTVVAYLAAARFGRIWMRIAIWTAAALLTLVIGFSRIYLGVHYPSDVLAGYAAGLFCVSSVLLCDCRRGGSGL
jgi:undecaprenyl-diphosphatase